MKSKKDKTEICAGNAVVGRLDGNNLRVSQVLTIHEASGFVRRVLRCIRSSAAESLVVDLEKVEQIDSAGVMALYYLEKKLEEKGVKVEFSGGSEAVLEKFRLFYPKATTEVKAPPPQGLFERVGAGVHNFFNNYVVEFLLLASNIFYWGIVDLFRPGARRKGEFVNQAVLIGVNAVLIIVFLSFVIGYVIALHSAGQLRTFGANIFVVDLVVFSIMGQMGPMITAILVAGRSGSSIAAEIATMKVTAELDALKTMGLNPNRFVVVPKLYACMFTMPFLIVFANVSGIVGGGLAAYLYLDISPEVFINRMAEIMLSKDLFTALVKSQVAAGLIVLTGSFFGFRVEKGAEGVGKVTTLAVVVAITLVIIADSILGVIFY
ncbi:MAG: ABC transporter permease [Bacteroidales bacterium]